MSKIYTANWGEFKIKDLFEIKSPKARTQNKYNEGLVPYVSSGAFNNGICGYLEPKDEKDIDKGNCITVSPLDGTSFYQEKDFLGRGGSGASILKLYNTHLSKYNALFICSVIRRIADRFGYNDLLNGDNLKNLSIKLPIHKIYAPDFAKLQDVVGGGVDVDMTKIDTSTWKEFKLSSIIEDMYICKSLDYGKMCAGKTAFVNRSSSNNGIQGYVKAEPYEKKDCITVGMVGNSKHAFWQEVDFVASQNILVLRNKKWNKEIGLFICSLINNYLKGKCDYKEILKKDTFDNVSVLLPVKEVEEPDWEYMEKYIKDIENRVSDTLTSLNRVRVNSKFLEIKEWKPFKMGELFKINPTKSYKETNGTLFDENGKNPVIVNSSFNNGIGGYTNKEITEKGGIITFSDTTTSDSIFYQDNDFVGYPHVQGLHPIGEFKDCWSKKSLQFFVSVFKSSAKVKNFDYSNKFTREEASQLTVYLPVKSDGSPDYCYMDKYIESVYGGATNVLKALTTLIN